MASRKEQKEQARAARLAREQESAAKRQRTRRLQVFGGVIAAAVIVVIVAIALSSGGGGAKKVDRAQAKADYAAVHSLLAGIPQHGTTLGNPKAPVTLTYFGDLECPTCRAFTITPGYLSQFIQQRVRTGNVKVVYRSSCTATCNNHPQSVFTEQQVAAYATGMQNLFWDYAELFYQEQQDETSDYVNATWLQDLAEQIPGLKLPKWKTDLKDPNLSDQVDADMAEALKLKLTGTPTLIMSGPKGSELVTGPGGAVIPAYSDLEAAAKAVA
ncbi:MAG: DsbA family protein [Solirubrobacteraceae bacterium]